MSNKDAKPYVPFLHPQKEANGVCVIGSTDDTTLEVEAQFNPKELEISKSVPWSKNPQANKSPTAGIQLEFTGAEGRSMSLELLFDGYEKGESVAPRVDKLNQMASPREAGSTDENKRRPHLCAVKWGATVPKFTCVIESLSTKYTMFSAGGVPLRATCVVKLKEADSVKMAKSDGAAGATTAPSGGTGGGTGGGAH